MAILKSTDELRSILYYNKYIYKATFKETGLVYSRYANTLVEFEGSIKRAKDHAILYKFLSRFSDRVDYWDSIDMDLISQFLSWKEKYKENITIRLEQDAASVFFNDINVLDDLDEFIAEINLTRINLQATGKFFFKKTPKYNYRMYFKKNIYKFGDELDEFIINNAKNKDIYFSKSLLSDNNPLGAFLPYRLPHRGGFIDYNNESTLTLLHMYFSSAIGKVYKLEKEPK